MLLSILGLIAASPAWASSFTLRESLADAEKDEGLRVVLTGIEAPTDFSGASLILNPRDFDVGPIRFDRGCEWWEFSCEWGWDTPPAPGTTRVLDAYKQVFTRKELSALGGGDIVVGDSVLVFLSAVVTDGAREELVTVPVEVVIGAHGADDAWTEVYCAEGACSDGRGEPLATYGVDRDLALRVSGTLNAKGNLRIELQSDRHGCAGGTCDSDAALSPAFNGGVSVAIADLDGDRVSDDAPLGFVSTRVETAASDAIAASVKANVGMRQGTRDLEWSVTGSDGATLAKGTDTLRVDIRDLVLRRGLLDIPELGDPSLAYVAAASDFDDLVGMDVTVSARGGDDPSETLTLVHSDIRRILGAVMPTGGNAVGSDVTISVSALNADGKSLGVIGQCGVVRDTGARCDLSGGLGSVRLGKTVEAADAEHVTVVVTLDALADANKDGVRDADFASVSLTLKGAAGAATARNTRDLYTATEVATLASFGAALEGVEAPYTVDVALSPFSGKGETTGVWSGSYEMLEPWGEVLIDGPKFEVE